VSLLDNPTDVLQVYVEVDGTDSDGNVVKVPGGTPVEVKGRVQPFRPNSESSTGGQVTTTTYQYIGRTWPSGAFAAVQWDGRWWDVDGEPMWSRGSEATRHVTVRLRARGPLEV